MIKTINFMYTSIKLKRERQKKFGIFSEPYKVVLEKKMSNSHENFGMIINRNWPSHILNIL